MKNWSKVFKKWRSLNGQQKGLFCKTFVVLVCVKIGLTFLPFRRFYKLYNTLTNIKKNIWYSASYIDDSIWAVKAISYYMPFEVLCLPQALALKYLLRQQTNIELHIGVQKENTQFVAHAWVESDNRILIGDTPTSFVPIWIWQ